MTEFWNFSPRRPRHQTTSDKPVVLVRTDDKQPWSEAELSDISRDGIRLLNAPLLEVGSRVQLLIPIDADWHTQQLRAATVRWSAPHTDEEGVDRETGVLACECDLSIEWEVLGELILSGSLDVSGLGAPGEELQDTTQ